MSEQFVLPDGAHSTESPELASQDVGLAHHPAVEFIEADPFERGGIARYCQVLPH